MCVYLISASPPETPCALILEPQVVPFLLHHVKDTTMNQEKLTKLQAQVCIGGKGLLVKRRWFIEQLQQMIKQQQKKNHFGLS